MPHVFRTQRRAAVLIVQVHEMLQHFHEQISFPRLERGQDQPLRGLNGRLDIAEHAAAQWCNGKRFCTPVDRAAEASDELFHFQARYHVPNGGAIEGNDVAKRRLIHPRMIVDGDQSGILNRSDLEFSSLIHEQGQRNLLQPANEVAGLFKKKAIAVCHQKSRYFQSVRAGY